MAGYDEYSKSNNATAAEAEGRFPLSRAIPIVAKAASVPAAVAREALNTYQEAAAQLPADAKWSSTFGNPGDGGYTEYHRQPDGTRWIIGNGPWHLIECEFDWHCQKVEG